MSRADQWLALLEAERARRRVRTGEDERAAAAFFAELQEMAQRLAALAPRYPLTVADMSPAEMLACHLLPEELRPLGLKSEDEIWAEVAERGK